MKFSLTFLSFFLVCYIATAQTDRVSTVTVETEIDTLSESGKFYDFLDFFDKSRRKRNVQTRSNLYVNVGFNHALSEDNEIGSLYRFWGSSFIEVGLQFNTRLSRNSDMFRLGYGVSLVTRSLRINDDRIFVTNDNITRLIDNPTQFNIDKSYFRQAAILLPVHLEIGSGDKKQFADGVYRYDRDNGITGGIGGFIGYTYSPTMSYEYEREGRDVNVNIVGDYEINRFEYGLSGYVNLGSLGFFAKYNLNTIFDGADLDENYISFGISIL